MTTLCTPIAQCKCHASLEGKGTAQSTTIGTTIVQISCISKGKNHKAKQKAQQKHNNEKKLQASGIECRGQSQGYTNVLSDLNICFVVAYTTEAVLKNTAMGPWKYIRDNW